MNKKRIFILLIFVLMITGCIKYDATMSLESDKSFTFTLISAFQKEYAGATDESVSYEEYEKLGYQVETYSDDTYSGVKLIKKFDSIDDVSSSNCGQVELTQLLELDPNTFLLFNSNKVDTITTYTANFTYNLTQPETEASDEDIDYSEFNETMVLKYTMSFPKNATIISNNADEKSNGGNTLTWNMKYGELKNINFSFSLDENNIDETIVNNEINQDNNVNDNNIDNNNNNDDNENINETDNQNQDQDSSSEEHNTKNEQSLGSIFGVLIAIILIGGLFCYKIKVKKDSITPTTPMSHSNPPKRK